MERRRTKNFREDRIATRTCSVNFLPLPITSTEVAKIFKTHGSIDHIYIPLIKPHANHKAAFVQFHYPQPLPTAVRDEHGRKLGSHRITVHPAKFDKALQLHQQRPPSHLPPPPPKPPLKPQKTHPANQKIAMRGQRTYKEVAAVPLNPQTKPMHTYSSLISI